VIFCLSDFVNFLAEILGKFAKRIISSVKLTNFTNVFGTFPQFFISQNWINKTLLNTSVFIFFPKSLNAFFLILLKLNYN
jgi:hypothetical protein